MKDAVEARKGIIVNGQNINNLRFADDAVILACSCRSLQKIVDSLQFTVDLQRVWNGDQCQEDGHGIQQGRKCAV